MKKYELIAHISHYKLIDLINQYYTCCGWRIISIVKGNNKYLATLERKEE